MVEYPDVYTFNNRNYRKLVCSCGKIYWLKL